MMRVVGCPSCEQNLAVDEFVPAAAVIQCPFCQADHPLGDMAEARLPMAIVLEMPAVEISDGEVSDDALDDQPLSEDGELRGALKFGSGNAVGSASAQEQGERSGDSEELRLAGDNPSKSTSESEEASSAVATAEEEIAADDEATPQEPDITSQPASPLPRSVTKRRRKRGPSMVALMVQVVLGGVIGIGGTILGLLWLPGSLRRDPFNVGYEIGKVAPWIVPAQYRPLSTASSSGNSDSGNSANANVTNARNGGPSSRTKLAKDSGDKTNAAEELPEGAFARKAKELEQSLNETEKGESLDDMEPLLGGSGDSTKDAASEEDLTLEPIDDSDEVVEEPVTKPGDDAESDDANADDDKPKGETEAESESTEPAPAESEPTVPSEDTVPSDDAAPSDETSPDAPTESTEPAMKEDEATESPSEGGEPENSEGEVKEGEAKEEAGEDAPTESSEPVESLKPPVEEPGSEEASNKESDTLAKATAASEELTRVLADKELPQQREAAQSFYSAICGLSDVSAPTAVETLIKAATDRLHSQVIAQGAASFLDRAETVGKPLVVAGKVTSSKTMGSVTEIKINLAAKEPREVVLITAAGSDALPQADDEIVAIGFLVDCESTPIEGYEGTGKVLSQSRIGRIPAPVAQ